MRGRPSFRLIEWFPPAFIALAGGLPPTDSHLVGHLAALALALPLLWRRRAPTAVFAAVALLALVQLVVGLRSFGDASLLVALYTIASLEPTERLAAAAVVIEAGIILATFEWAPLHGVLPSFVTLNAMAIAATVIGVNVRNRRELVDSLRDRADRLERERDQQGQLAAAAERARIAREMHDIVAHNLSVMIALADGAAYQVDEAPERADEAMRNVSRTGRQALTEMRRLLGVLREQVSDSTLAPQPGLHELDALIDQVRGAGLPVTLVVEGDGWGALPPGLQLAAYRIVQEALTNTLKHAGPAASANVRLAGHDDGLHVEVSDTGMAAPGVPIGEGGGLRGMRERAGVYGGTVEAGPAPEGGWRVVTTLSALAGAVA